MQSQQRPFDGKGKSILKPKALGCKGPSKAKTFRRQMANAVRRQSVNCTTVTSEHPLCCYNLLRLARKVDLFTWQKFMVKPYKTTSKSNLKVSLPKWYSNVPICLSNNPQTKYFPHGCHEAK